MNYAELRGKIVAKGYTVGSFCEECGFDRSTFDRRMKGKSEFTLSEICTIIRVLKLTWEEARAIFFTYDVA